MNKRQLFAGVLSASLLVSALPGLALAQDETTSDDSATPEDTEWALASLAGETVPEEVETTLLLSGGEAVGNAGCNSYFGAYELDGEMLSFPTPFGLTQKFCEGPAQEVEDAYLPLLQETTTWSIDDEGALSLADADGTVQLVFGEALVDVTATDVDNLVAVLGDLQEQIDLASAEIAALTQAAESLDVNKLDKRISNIESSVKQLEKKTNNLNVSNLKKRISANEKAIAAAEEAIATNATKIGEINKTINKLRDRIKVLEATAADHEARIAALENPPATP